MKKIFFIVFAFFISSQISIAQNTNFSKKTFQKNNNIFLLNTTTTSDGGALLVGKISTFNSPNNFTSFLLKIDKNGQKKWVKSFSANQISNGIINYALELSGGFTLLTISDKNTSYLLLLDNNQNILWTQELSSNFEMIPLKIVELSNGNVAVLVKNLEKLENFSVIVADINGNIVFNNQYSHVSNVDYLEAKDINLTQQGDLMISSITAGNFILSPTTILPNIIKIKSKDGSIFSEFTYSFNFPNNQSFEKIFERQDGSIVVHGRSYSTDPNSTTGVDGILNFSQQGQLSNASFFAKNQPRYMNMAQLDDNEYFLTLEINSIDERNLITISSNGQIKNQFKEPKVLGSRVFGNIAVLKDKSIIFSEFSPNCKSIISNIFRRQPNQKKGCGKDSNIKPEKSINFAASPSVIVTTKPSIFVLKKVNNVLKINDIELQIGEESTTCPDTIKVKKCDGDFYQIGQNKYTTSGFFSNKTLDENGCDSLIYIDLKFLEKQKKIDTITEKTCKNKPIKIANTTISKSGIYDFVLKNKFGCDSTFFVKITDETIKLNVQKSYNINAGDSQILLTNPNVSGLKYEWSPSTFLNCTDCENPETTPFSNIKYNVKASNSANCETTAEINIFVSGCEKTYIPNSISPNDDGINDVHSFFTSPCVEQIIQYAIYDRWGNKIYKKNDFLPENNIGWDGQYKSQNANKGVYTYYLLLQLKDGKTQTLSGDLTVF